MSSSRLSPDMIGRIASSLGLEEKMGHETAQALATEVEVRLRLLIQDAKKFADHANRTAITPEDINQAVILHGDNKLIGFASERQMHIAAQFHRSAQSAQLRGRAGGGDKQSSADPDIYFYRDQTLGIEQAAEAARQAKRPCAPELLCHFLAIHGSQPAIAENPDQHPNADILPFVKPVTISSTTDAAKNVRIDKIVEHELSSEQISYFKTVVKDVLSSSRSSLRMVYASLSADFGLQNMLPYFIRFMSDQHLHIFKNEPRPLWSLPRLRALLCMTQCMLSNRSINVEAYLHQLNPMILTVLVNRLLTSSVAEDHWALRDYAANLAAKICDIYDSKYPDMRIKMVKTLFRILHDRTSPYTSQYGAIVGLAALGLNVTEQALVPIAPVFLRRVFALLQKFGAGHPTTHHVSSSSKNSANGHDVVADSTQPPNPMQAVEAQRCVYQLRVALGALLRKLLVDSSAEVVAQAVKCTTGGKTSTQVALLRSVVSDAGLPFLTAGNLLSETDCRHIGGAFTKWWSPSLSPQQPPSPVASISASGSSAVAWVGDKCGVYKRITAAQVRRQRQSKSFLNHSEGHSKSSEPVSSSPAAAMSVAGSSSSSSSSTENAANGAVAKLLEKLVDPDAAKLLSAVESKLKDFLSTCHWVVLTRLYTVSPRLGTGRRRRQLAARFADNLVSSMIASVRPTASSKPVVGMLDPELTQLVGDLRSSLVTECSCAAVVATDGHAAVLSKWRAEGAEASDTEQLTLRKILAVSGPAAADVRTGNGVVVAAETALVASELSSSEFVLSKLARAVCLRAEHAAVHAIKVGRSQRPGALGRAATSHALASSSTRVVARGFGYVSRFADPTSHLRTPPARDSSSRKRNVHQLMAPPALADNDGEQPARHMPRSEGQ